MTALLPFALQCAMCYQNASAQAAKGIAAINSGIIALALPLVAVIGGITWVTWRRASDSRDDE